MERIIENKQPAFNADDLKDYESKFSTKKILGIIGNRYGYRCFKQVTPLNTFYCVELHNFGEKDSCYIQTFDTLAEVCFFIGNVELNILL